MLATERQQKIINILQKSGAVTTANLVETFDVSVETIRRDLLFLEQQGSLSRVHGGAVTKGDMKPFANLEQRNLEFVPQKVSLAQKAMAFISEGDVIAVDEGSTAILFAKALKEHFDTLTVITHSLDVFNLLNQHKNFQLILCGGHFLRHPALSARSKGVHLPQCRLFGARHCRLPERSFPHTAAAHRHRRHGVRFGGQQ